MRFRKRKDKTLTEQVKACKRCDVRKECKAPVPGEGDPSALVMLIGESPGGNEDRQGRPFVGYAGYELNGYLQDFAKLNRSQTYITNLIKCHPRADRSPAPEEIRNCWDYLMQEISAIKPTIIATLGKEATQALLGPDIDLESHHGLSMDSPWGRVMPCYHPAAGMRQTSMMSRIQEDFARLGHAIRGYHFSPPIPDVERGSYRRLEGDRPEDVEMLIERLSGAQSVAIDTELTPGSPWCLSLAVEPSEAFVILWEPRNKPLFRILQERVTDTSVTTVLHNSLFDLGVLARMGITPTRVEDTMIMSYLLGDEPQGLKPLAYRIAGMQMQDYNSVVSHATNRKAIQYFNQVLRYEWPKPKRVLEFKPDGKVHLKQPQTINQRMRRALNDLEKFEWLQETARLWRKYREGALGNSWKVWESFSHSRSGWHDKAMQMKNPPESEKLFGVLLEERLSLANPVNLYERWSNWEGEDKDDIIAIFGDLHPGNLSDIDIDTATEYAARDADATIRIYPYLRNRIIKRGLLHVFHTDTDLVPMVQDMQDNGFKIDPEYLSSLNAEFKKTMSKHQRRINAVAGHHVDPASPDQVRNFLFGELRLPSTGKRSKKTGLHSTDNEVLEILMSKHDVVKDIQLWRQYNKLSTTYAEVLPKKVDSNNRIHPRIRITRVSTGRLSCADPNLMNIPVRTEEGAAIRKGFIAGDGCMLASGDYSQIEMRIAAHLSDDAEMKRVFDRGLDIHAETASNMFGIPVDRLDKKKHRYPAKRTGFGVLYGITGERLYALFVMEHADEGWSPESCDELISEWFKIYKGVDKHRKSVWAQARRTGRAKDMFGRERLIPEVRSRLRWIKEAGERQSFSMVIQGSAQGVIKRGMKFLTPVYKGFREEGCVCNPLIQIHDDLVFEVSEDRVDDFLSVYKSIMEGVVKLSVPVIVETSKGRNWEEL